MRAARVVLFVLIPLAWTVVSGLLGSLGVLSGADGRAFDRLVGMRAPAAVPPQLVLVDISAPQGSSLAGTLADGLVTLKEMDARSAVLDLPLAQKSPPALDASALRQTLPNALDAEFSQMEENIQSLFDAIRRGSVRPKDAARYVADLVGLVAQAKGRLFSAAMGIQRDDDALLGQSAAFFGRVYAPLELLSAADPAVPSDLLDLALQKQSLPVLVAGRDPSVHAAGIRPSVLPVVTGAHGGGFPSDDVEADGVRREARLLAEHGGQHMGSLGFAVALDLMGNPSIEATAGRITLRGAVLPGRPSATLSIPLTESGGLLLSWPRAQVGDGFRSLSWSVLLTAHRLEDSLVSDLRDLDSRGYLSYLRSPQSLLDVYEEAARLGRGMLAAGNDADADQWRAARERFFSLCDQFLSGDAETRIVADANRRIQGGTLSDEEKALASAERDRVHGAFEDARQVLTRLQQAREELHASLAGAFCIVSLQPDERTVAGVTPFGVPVPDSRVTAAVVSTLLSGQFLREASPTATFIIALILCLAVAGALLRLKPLLALLVGLAATAVSAVGLGIALAEYGAFVPPAAPLIAVFFTGISLSSLKQGWKRAAARTLRAAFARRLSTEDMRRIHMGRLAPDGSRRVATILCLSEREPPPAADDPAEIVRGLRTHRQAIGEAVRGLGGMLIDSGRRITASFGAPVDSDDHARRAFVAALRVRALERELNGSARALFSSRIGIHTGECIAGFLGPTGLPVYDLVGKTADIAVGLEGLNGSFGTMILLSEQARAAAGSGFLVRMLGTIPVVPREHVRVYELLAESGEADVPAAPIVTEFEEGVALFEKGQTAAALAVFTRVLAQVPGDGPSAAYAQRCRLLLERHRGSEIPFFPW